MLFVVGKTYPIETTTDVGAVINLQLKSLLITVPDITDIELSSIMHGKASCGMLHKNSAIHLLWKFQGDHNKGPLIYETPFDVRIDEEKHFDDLETSDTRLLFSIHIVDTNSNKLVGLRSITWAPELSLAFLSAVQDQLVSHVDSKPQTDIWMKQDLITLAQSTKLWDMGVD